MAVELRRPVAPTQTASPSPEKFTALSGRSVVLSLALAVFFGYIIPIVDMKMRNTFLGATHLPPGAIAVLLVMLLVVNPLLYMVSRDRRGLLGLLGVTAGLLFLAGTLYLKSGTSTFSFWLFVALAALCILVVLLGARPFTRNEILTVYVSCLFSCLAPGHGAENVFVVNLLGPFYYATLANKWLGFMVPYIKPWMTPALGGGPGQPYGDPQRALVADWFQGSHNHQVPWGAWMVPLCVWGFFICVLYFMMACLCVMLRKQWAEREALAFPLLRLPLELTEDHGRPDAGAITAFFRNPLMWIGFGVVAFVQLMRGLHVYFPDFPDFPLSMDTSPMFQDQPWSQLGWTPVNIWPVVVGITYLLTSEISFSFWFFYWFVKFQLIGAYCLGFDPSSMPSPVGASGRAFVVFQQIGCYLAYVAIVLWTGREHFLHIAKRSLGMAKPTGDEANEGLSYPVAFWGFIGSWALILGWSIAAGMNPLLALVMWGLYLVIIIALTRIIAEAGILFVQQGWVPLGIISQITNSGGSHWLLNDSSIPAASMFQGSLMVDLRGFVMPSFIQGFKLAHDRKINVKGLLALMLACTFIAFGLGTYMNVSLGYAQGGQTLDPWYSGAASTQPASAAASLMHGVTTSSWSNLIWIAVGMGLTYGMMLARARMPWFPLHPIGFLVCLSYPMSQIWFSVFLGWLAKSLITRFGGTDSYRKTIPLFLGLALGDVFMMLFWLIVDGAQGHIGHKLMPG